MNRSFIHEGLPGTDHLRREIKKELKDDIIVKENAFFCPTNSKSLHFNWKKYTTNSNFSFLDWIKDPLNEKPIHLELCSGFGMKCELYNFILKRSMAYKSSN